MPLSTLILYSIHSIHTDVIILLIIFDLIESRFNKMSKALKTRYNDGDRMCIFVVAFGSVGADHPGVLSNKCTLAVERWTTSTTTTILELKVV